MAENNSSNQNYKNNADGFYLSGGTTPRKLTLSGGDVAIAGSGSAVLTFPSTTDTIVGRATTDTLTNKTLTSSTNVLGGVTLTLGSDANGDTYYRGSGVLTRVAKGTAGQVYTMNSGATAPEWQTPSTPFSAYYQTATDFGDTNRFNQNATGTGANTFAAFGVRISTGATAASYSDVQWYVTPAVQGVIFDGSPQFSCSLSIRNAPTAQPNTGTFYIGLGVLSYSGTSVTFTGKHIGFKLVVTGADTYSLYATQADGSTETASSALTTVTDTPDSLELCLKVNALSSVDYYWRKNGGAWSSATNLTTNLPTTGDTGRVVHFLGINQNTANNNEIEVSGASYRR